MRLIGKKLLFDFKKKHADARSRIESWEAEVEEAEWDAPHELKKRYLKASLVKNNQVIFDIYRNKYRLLTQVNYKNKIVLIHKIGTHKEYDKWRII
jgi:mRNA interferase HigB